MLDVICKCSRFCGVCQLCASHRFSVERKLGRQVQTECDTGFASRKIGKSCVS
uniref:Uncharacterized protein n=1 Tax=Vitis vinifera TaxID=29760 RepID=F6H3Y0_VITVI